MLKQIAPDSGVDVPMYTVTRWDGASFPPRAVLPVVGGHPAAPWDASITALPPHEVSLIRFANRVAGDMGTQGTRGFVFFANHVRNYSMPERRGVQVTLRLPGGTVQRPRLPITIPSDACGIWPVNLDVGGARLTDSTAQPLARLAREAGGATTYFYGAATCGYLPGGVQPWGTGPDRAECTP